jgi:hypothetical protein
MRRSSTLPGAAVQGIASVRARPHRAAPKPANPLPARANMRWRRRRLPWRAEWCTSRRGSTSKRRPRQAVRSGYRRREMFENQKAARSGRGERPASTGVVRLQSLIEVASPSWKHHRRHRRSPGRSLGRRWRHRERHPGQARRTSVATFPKPMRSRTGRLHGISQSVRRIWRAVRDRKNLTWTNGQFDQLRVQGRCPSRTGRKLAGVGDFESFAIARHHGHACVAYPPSCSPHCLRQ